MTEHQKLALHLLFEAHACQDPIARAVLIRDAEAHMLMIFDLPVFDNHDSEPDHSVASAAR